jgi:tetratricopeptide (TPR) repeat protein
MTSFRLLAVVLLGCLALTASAPSLAASSDQGRAAFAEGQKLFLAGDFRGALTWFKNGYAHTQDASFLLNMAQCHRSLGEAQEALAMFRQYLKSSPEATNPEARAVATKAISELESEAKTAPSATTAAGGLAPAPVTAPASAGAAVALGAASTSETGRRFEMGPGGMPVLPPAPELDAASASEAVANAPDTTDKTRRHLRVAAMVCGAVGLVSVGTGIYYWTDARSLSDSAEGTAVYNKATYDDGKHAETMQWIFYGVGAAAVATGAGLWVYSKWFLAPRPATVSLAPMVTPGAAGLAAVGVF